MELRMKSNYKTYTMSFIENTDDVFVSKKRRSVYCVIFPVGAFLLLFIGAWIGSLWYKQHMSLRENVLEYGVTEQDLRIGDVLWKDYPSYRGLTFTIDGMISFRLPRNVTVCLDGLADTEMLQEKSREHCVSSNGTDVLYYDLVSYYLNDGKVSANIPKIYQDNIICSVKDNSYYLTFDDGDMEYCVGCISLLDTEYVSWTADEIKYADVNLNAYLPAFQLSGTYDIVKPLHQKSPKKGIILEKKGGNGFQYAIYNQTLENWCYESQLPHIELWYKGIWIELVSPFDYNLTSEMINASEIKEYEIPEKLMSQYSAFLEGIYRLVIYGENQEFIVSDIFYMGV